jgi:hypothetical protein
MLLSFDTPFPTIAKDEYLVLQVRTPGAVPVGDYLFREFYCVEPRCDCRRVRLQIYSADEDRAVATIGYAFEPPAPPYDEFEEQLALEPLAPQSAFSSDLLGIVEHVLDNDPEYRERLIRHYEMMKDTTDNPDHPQHHKVHNELHDDPHFTPAYPERKTVRRASPKVAVNAPCPCGSGRKYKVCCRQG